MSESRVATGRLLSQPSGIPVVNFSMKMSAFGPSFSGVRKGKRYVLARQLFLATSDVLRKKRGLVHTLSWWRINFLSDGCMLPQRFRVSAQAPFWKYLCLYPWEYYFSLLEASIARQTEPKTRTGKDLYRRITIWRSSFKLKIERSLWHSFGTTQYSISPKLHVCTIVLNGAPIKTYR